MKEGSTCYGTVEVANTPYWKVGAPFLRNVYTSFGATFDDKGTPSFNVAFADKVPRIPSTNVAEPPPAPTSAAVASAKVGLVGILVVAVLPMLLL